MTSIDDENRWEYSKENVVPIKRGRSVKGLANSLQAIEVSQGNKEVEIERDKMATERFERELKSVQDMSTSSDNDNMLLDVYVKHYKWIRDTYPSDNSKSLTFLERATFDLKENESCRNDSKLVKMWCEYADSVRNPGEIFSFMQSNKIGDKNALFWIAWAFVAEKAQNYNMTDQIYQKGLKRQALPRELIQKRYQQFQRRMTRLMLDREKNGESLDLTEHSNHENRSDKSRKALGNLSKSQASSGVSRLPKSNSTQQGGLGGGSSSSSRSHQVPKSNETFDIFVDSAPVVDSQLHENSNWKTLAKANDSTKENVEQAKKWSESGGISVPHRSSSIQQQSTAPVSQPIFSSIPIFVDESCQNKVKVEDSAEITEGLQTSSRPGLSVRAKLEKAPMESLMKNPLARHKEGQEEISKDSRKSSQKVESQPSKEMGENVVKQISVPTSGGFTIFGSLPDDKIESKASKTTAPSKVKSAPSSSAVHSTDFQIFTDDMDHSKVKAPAKHANSTGLGFTVFTDEDRSLKTKKSLQQEGQSHKSGESEFSIFHDICGEGEGVSQAPEVGRDTVKLKSAQDMEDDEIMGVVGLELADSEDATINTKLAKMDIDSMFCSPGLTPSTKRNNRLQLQRTFGNLSDIKEPSGDDADRSIFGTLATPFESSHQKAKQDSYFLASSHKIDGLNMMKIHEDETFDGDDTIEIKNMINENFKLPGEESLATMRKAKSSTVVASNVGLSCISSCGGGGGNESNDRSGIDLGAMLDDDKAVS